MEKSSLDFRYVVTHSLLEFSSLFFLPSPYFSSSQYSVPFSNATSPFSFTSSSGCLAYTLSKRVVTSLPFLPSEIGCSRSSSQLYTWRGYQIYITSLECNTVIVMQLGERFSEKLDGYLSRVSFISDEMEKLYHRRQPITVWISYSNHKY